MLIALLHLGDGLPDGQAAHLLLGNRHRGERRRGVGGVLDVVEAHQGDILGNAQAPIADRPQGPDGQVIVGEDGRELVRPLEERLRRIVAPLGFERCVQDELLP